MLLQLRQTIQTLLYVMALLALENVFGMPNVTTAEIGGCKFSTKTLAIQGSALEQSKCLLTPVLPKGLISKPLQSLPTTLGKLVGQPVEISIDDIAQYLKLMEISPDEIGGELALPRQLPNSFLPVFSVFQILRANHSIRYWKH